MRYLFLLFVLLPQLLWCQSSDSALFATLYPWIEDVYPVCDGLEFEEYDNGAFAYIYVSDGTLYFQDGTYYCGDGVDRDCRQLYGLASTSISNVFRCSDEIPPDNDDENQSIELFVDTSFVEIGNEFCLDVSTNAIEDLLSFQFQIQVSNQNLTINQAVSSSIPDVFTLIEDDIVKFLWFSEDLLPTQVESGMSLATICFTVVDNAENQTQINLVNTERLFAQFITVTSSGDFYENTDVSFAGGLIEIQTLSENPIEEDSIAGIPISEYPWMSAIIDSLGCEGTIVTEYNFGSYSFFYFSSRLKNVVYYHDGSFYCRDSPSRDCKTFYQLAPDKITNQWSCCGGY